MDQNSTSFLDLSDNLISTALKSVSYGSPKDKTLDFIRNFAAGIRIINDLPGNAGVFSLN